MTEASTFLGDKILNWLKGTAFSAAPASIYASLWNGDPDAGGTEVTGTVNLTRQAITLGAVGSRQATTTATINFGTANGAASVSFFAIYDASTNGNQLLKKAIPVGAISNGLPVRVLSGDLVLSY